MAGAALSAVAIIGLAWIAYPRAAGSAIDGAQPGAATSGDPDGLEGGLRGAKRSEGPGQGPSVEATDLLARAKTLGGEWNRDAVLVSLRADPIVAGRVPVEKGGTVEFVFAIPAGKLGPGARVGKDRFTVTFTGTEPTTRISADAALGRGVADPACTGNDAWRAAVASGVPSNARTTLTYTNSEKHERAVWRAESAEDPKLNRTIDGQRCTILTR
ncbi:MAG: hypothetical protein JW751_22490 [Polyangiaceae bacterium]|nr:hypothetical protein [Polyangiaceae bacterium]